LLNYLDLIRSIMKSIIKEHKCRKCHLHGMKWNKFLKKMKCKFCGFYEEQLDLINRKEVIK